jgi:glyoxylase-like metal-dependent hydrolase (beta-lactamase superfamily II)
MADVRRLRLAYNNVYMVDAGGEPVLVDTGPDYRGAWETIEAWLDGRMPSQVLVTHGHHDHASLGAAWQRAGVPVAVGAGDERLVRGPQLQSDEELAAFTRFVAESGAPEHVRKEAVASLVQRRAWALRAAQSHEYPPAGKGGRWPTGLRYEPFEPGAMPTAAGGVEAVASPGHTPGNHVFVVGEQGWLFSGDQLLPEITPTPSIQARAEPDWTGDWRFQSLPEFAGSLERIRTLGLVRCYPGHGEPFDDVDRALAQNLGVIERRTERVLAALRERGPATLFGLTERIYPRGAGRRFWQVVATVQGHLDLLEARGEASRLEGGWTATA